VLSTKDVAKDPTYELATLAYWGAVEVNLAIICACLTTLKPLLQKLLPNLLGSAAYGQTATAYGTTAVRNRRGGSSALSSATHRGRTEHRLEKPSVTKLREIDEELDGSAVSDETQPSPLYRMDDLEAQSAYGKQGL